MNGSSATSSTAAWPPDVAGPGAQRAGGGAGLRGMPWSLAGVGARFYASLLRKCAEGVAGLCRPPGETSVRAVRAPDGVDRPPARAEHRQPDEAAEPARGPHARR